MGGFQGGGRRVGNVLGEALAWSEKLGLAPKVFCRTFLLSQKDNSTSELGVVTSSKQIAKHCFSPKETKPHSFSVSSSLFLRVSLSLSLFRNEKNMPERKFSGRISRGRPGVIRADVPGQNLLAGP